MSCEQAGTCVMRHGSAYDEGAVAVEDEGLVLGEFVRRGHDVWWMFGESFKAGMIEVCRRPGGLEDNIYIRGASAAVLGHMHTPLDDPVWDGLRDRERRHRDRRHLRGRGIRVLLLRSVLPLRSILNSSHHVRPRLLRLRVTEHLYPRYSCSTSTDVAEEVFQWYMDAQDPGQR